MAKPEYTMHFWIKAFHRSKRLSCGRMDTMALDKDSYSGYGIDATHPMLQGKSFWRMFHRRRSYL